MSQGLWKKHTVRSPNTKIKFKSVADLCFISWVPSPAFTTWSVWSQKNILLDKFPLGIPTSGAVLNFFANLHKNAKNSFKGAQWWLCCCWPAEKVLNDHKTRSDGNIQRSAEVAATFSSYVFSQFGYKPSCSFLLLFMFVRGSTTEARLQVQHVSTVTHISKDLCAHLRSCSSSYCLHVA